MSKWLKVGGVGKHGTRSVSLRPDRSTKQWTMDIYVGGEHGRRSDRPRPHVKSSINKFNVDHKCRVILKYAHNVIDKLK